MGVLFMFTGFLKGTNKIWIYSEKRMDSLRATPAEEESGPKLRLLHAGGDYALTMAGTPTIV